MLLFFSCVPQNKVPQKKVKEIAINPRIEPKFPKFCVLQPF